MSKSYDIKNALIQFFEKMKKYKKYEEKLALIFEPYSYGGKISPGKKLKRGILFLILPISLIILLCFIGFDTEMFNSIEKTKEFIIYGSIPVSLAILPSLVYFLRYMKDKIVISKIEKQMDNVLSNYESEKELLKKEIKKIEEECKQKGFFNEICEIITKKFFISEEKKDLDEKRNLYIITQEYCFVCSNCCLEEKILLLRAYYNEIYNFYKNKIADLPNILYKQALINAIAKKVKTDILTKINQEPEKFKNYNLKIEIDSILWRLVNYSLDQFYVCTSYDEKDANVIYNKDCSCTITLTYDGEEYTHEKW